MREKEEEEKESVRENKRGRESERERERMIGQSSQDSEMFGENEKGERWRENVWGGGSFRLEKLKLHW